MTSLVHVCIKRVLNDVPEGQAPWGDAAPPCLPPNVVSRVVAVGAGMTVAQFAAANRVGLSNLWLGTDAGPYGHPVPDQADALVTDVFYESDDRPGCYEVGVSDLRYVDYVHGGGVALYTVVLVEPDGSGGQEWFDKFVLPHRLPVTVLADMFGVEPTDFLDAQGRLDLAELTLGALAPRRVIRLLQNVLGPACLPDQPQPQPQPKPAGAAGSRRRRLVFM